MRRSVELHSSRGPQSKFIPVAEAMQSVGCTPSEACIVGCEALKTFLNSTIPASATSLFRPKFEAIAAGEGPKHKSFGRVACCANLKK